MSIIYKKEKHQISKTITKIITYKPKTFKIPNIVVIKSVIIEHPKTSHKLYKAEKSFPLGSNSSLYSKK